MQLPTAVQPPPAKQVDCSLDAAASCCAALMQLPLLLLTQEWDTFAARNPNLGSYLPDTIEHKVKLVVQVLTRQLHGSSADLSSLASDSSSSSSSSSSSMADSSTCEAAQSSSASTANALKTASTVGAGTMYAVAGLGSDTSTGTGWRSEADLLQLVRLAAQRQPRWPTLSDALLGQRLQGLLELLQGCAAAAHVKVKAHVLQQWLPAAAWGSITLDVFQDCVHGVHVMCLRPKAYIDRRSAC